MAILIRSGSGDPAHMPGFFVGWFLGTVVSSGRDEVTWSRVAVSPSNSPSPGEDWLAPGGHSLFRDRDGVTQLRQRSGHPLTPSESRRETVGRDTSFLPRS